MYWTTALGCRIWQNYLMPSRLDELAAWSRLALELGYTFYSVEDYWRITQAGRTAPPPKSIVLRHDIDVDLATAHAMFSIESVLGITSSYYFRLRTITLPLMQAIAGAGGEASYHYEELATEAKAGCLRGPEQVRARLPLIRQRFLENLQSLRAQTGLPMITVASHGDWANRRLGLANTEILKCPDLRKSAAVQVEAYDSELMKFVTARYADTHCPDWWTGTHLTRTGADHSESRNGVPKTPAAAVRGGLPVIYVLLHPEQWRRGPRCHFREQVKRLREGVAYHFRVPLRPDHLSDPSGN